MLSRIAAASIGVVFGIGSVVAGSAAAGDSSAAAADGTCEENLAEALAGWQACRSERDTCKEKLKKCGGIIHYPSCGELVMQHEKRGGLTHKILLEAVSVRAGEFSVSDTVSLEKSMIDEFARRAPTADRKALDEMTDALELVRLRAEKTEMLLKATAEAK